MVNFWVSRFGLFSSFFFFVFVFLFSWFFGLGSRVQGLGRVQELGFRVQSVGSKV